MNSPAETSCRRAFPRKASAALQFISVGLFGLLVACDQGGAGKKGKGEARRPLESRTVSVAVLDARPMERVIAVVGSLLAQDGTTLSAKVPGRLETITVDLGSVVKKGQLIAQIERRDYELKLRQSESLLAQARVRLGLPLEGSDDHVDLDNANIVKEAKAVLDEASKNRDRIAALREKGIIPQSELETAEAAHQVAFSKHRDALEEIRIRQSQLAQRRVEVEIARQQLTDSTIFAPYDAVVQERHASAGEFLETGKRLAALVRVDSLRLRVEIPEREAAAVRAGQPVRVELEGGGAGATGVISRLSPVITEQNRMLIAEADLPNDGTLRPGAFVRAKIVVAAAEPVLAAPQDAVSAFVGLEKIYLVKDGKAVERLVTTGRRADGFVELVKGASVGDTVVLNPGSLQNGQPVVVEQSAVSGQRSAKSGQRTAVSKERTATNKSTAGKGTKQSKPAGP
ncbi:MAG: efflux RND transporter periplasmic adaptor subunit [Verrucomicrobia bacterium]|nr:efflux RND transporter periplasmic adaptor subunit [Verrucomicrobiota bacterium]